MLDSSTENEPSRIVEGRKDLDVAPPEYAEMAPILELAKSMMKSREPGK